MKLTDIKSNADLHQFIKGFYESHATALHGVLEKLPEALQKDLKPLYDSLNASLKALPPLEQVPAAQVLADGQQGWAFQSFADAMVRIQDYAQGLVERLTNFQKELDGKVVALNALNEQVTKGDLIPKAKAQEAIELARTEGAASLRPELVATRKTALEVAGIPVPGEDVLGLPGKDYEARLTNTRANLKALGEKGLKLGGKGDSVIKRTAWLTATEFNGQITELEGLLGGKLDSLNSGPRPDPLLGNPNPGSETTTGPKVSLC